MHSEYVQTIIDSLDRNVSELEDVNFTANTVIESNVFRVGLADYLRTVSEKLMPVAQAFRDAGL
jgi:hypothetical protein